MCRLNSVSYVPRGPYKDPTRSNNMTSRCMSKEDKTSGTFSGSVSNDFSTHAKISAVVIVCLFMSASVMAGGFGYPDKPAKSLGECLHRCRAMPQLPTETALSRNERIKQCTSNCYKRFHQKEL